MELYLFLNIVEKLTAFQTWKSFESRWPGLDFNRKLRKSIANSPKIGNEYVARKHTQEIILSGYYSSMGKW